MLHQAPQPLMALEQSAFASAIRQSTWAYLTANVGHILALMLFVSAVAIMAARLLGALAATPPAGVVRPARRCAALGLALMALTGSMLFSAEATHLASNPVFQIKASLIGLGILNAVRCWRAGCSGRRSMARGLCAVGESRGRLRHAAVGYLVCNGRLRASHRVFLNAP
jgi:hypothetical protein